PAGLGGVVAATAFEGIAGMLGGVGASRGTTGYVAVADCWAMTGICEVAGSTGGGGGGGGGAACGATRGPRCPATISSMSSGVCVEVSADLISIIALGSSQRASARSGLSEMSLDSLVYAPAS